MVAPERVAQSASRSKQAALHPVVMVARTVRSGSVCAILEPILRGYWVSVLRTLLYDCIREKSILVCVDLTQVRAIGFDAVKSLQDCRAIKLRSNPPASC
jgi:hypothetical protein